MGKRSKRSNITVAVRVRPLINKELRTNDGSCIKTDDNLIVVCKFMNKRYPGLLEEERGNFPLEHRPKKNLADN